MTQGQDLRGERHQCLLSPHDLLICHVVNHGVEHPVDEHADNQASQDQHRKAERRAEVFDHPLLAEDQAVENHDGDKSHENPNDMLPHFTPPCVP